MANLNRVIIAGNLGRDPEIRYTGRGEPVCHLHVATTDRWIDKASGEKKEQTEWHHVVLFRKLAEVAAEFLRKGEPVYLEGHLKTHKWTDARDIERYQTEIYADRLQMLGGAGQQQPAERDEPGIGDGADDPPAYADEVSPALAARLARREAVPKDVPF